MDFFNKKWKGIKTLVEDITEIYKLAEEGRRMYRLTNHKILFDS